MSQSTIVTNALTGITPSNLPYNLRQNLDANYIKSVALPSSASTVYTASLDLGDPVSGVPFSTTEIVDAVILAPALNATQLPNSATVTYQWQDSADNSTFANIAALNSFAQTGASSAGAAAVTNRVKLPQNTRRYIRISATTANSPGDCSAASTTAELVF